MIDAHINGLFLNSSFSPDNQLFDYEEVATLPLLNSFAKSLFMFVITYESFLNEQLFQPQSLLNSISLQIILACELNYWEFPL